MNSKISNYAAIRTFYEQGNDFVAVFGDLLLLALKQSEIYSVVQIRDSLSKNASFEMPIDVVKTILKRLHKNKLVDYLNLKDQTISSIKLTQEGCDKRKKLTSEYKDAIREKNALLDAIKKYAKEKRISLVSGNMEEQLNTFIKNGFPNVVLAENIELKEEQVKLENATEKLFLEFIKNTEEKDPVNYSRIKTILYGKVISQAILSNNIDPKQVSYKNIVIYLDTNVVFSLLGWHEDFYNQPVKELIVLLKKAGCKLRIFSFNKDELVQKLRGYSRSYDEYSRQIKVSSIYSVLKRKGFSKIDVIHFIENVESELEKIDIEIDYSFHVDELTKDKELLKSKLGTYKAQSNESSIQKDLSAILAIERLRNRNSVFSWNKAKAVFLSADTALSLYDLIEHSHKANGTLPEVIFTSDMTSIIWLGGGIEADSVFVGSFLTHYLRKDIIKDDLWDKFISAIREKKEKGDISESDIHDLISYSETEQILRSEGEKGIDKLLSDEKIFRLQKDRKERTEDKIKDQETIEKQSDKIENIKNVIELGCRKRCNCIINCTLALTGLALSGLTIYSGLRFGFSNLSVVIPVALFIIAIIGFTISLIIGTEVRFISYFVSIKNNLHNKTIQQCIGRKNKEFDL